MKKYQKMWNELGKVIYEVNPVNKFRWGFPSNGVSYTIEMARMKGMNATSLYLFPFQFYIY